MIDVLVIVLDQLDQVHTLKLLRIDLDIQVGQVQDLLPAAGAFDVDPQAVGMVNACAG